MTMNQPPGGKPNTGFRYRFGDFEYNDAQMGLARNGVPIDLDAIPLAVLSLLLENAGQVVTKEEFLDDVWSGRIVEDGSLTVAISKLRKAMAPLGSEYIRTVHKVGYQFMAKVECESVRRPALRAELQPGQHAPHTRGWTLDRCIGDGGYGEAWLAHDASERQRVFKYASSATALRALKRELASYRVIESLQPGAPGLLPILDSQFEKSPFYIATPYKGRSLDEWTEANRDQRIRVVAKAAHILSMAHRVGVLHLDVKPKNILVECHSEQLDAEVHVIDFGSAKLANPAAAINLGITLGQTISPDHPEVGSTPHFLAPEVLSGEVATTLSDVYSLGVVLYQAWVGDFNKPMATGWEADVDDPLIRSDIAAATTGDPTKRLASAEELAQRLDNLESRHTEYHKAEQQRRNQQRIEQELERTRARRPWVLTAGVAMATGIAVSLSLFAHSEQLRETAESNLSVANALNEFLVDDLFSQADPNIGGRATISLRDALDQSTEALPERFGSSPDLLRSINATLGQLYYRTTNYKEAASYYRNALDDSNSGELTQADLRIDYAQALMLSGELDKANLELDTADSQLAAMGETGGLQLKADVVRSRLLLLRTDWESLFPLVEKIESALATTPNADPHVVNRFFGAALDGYMAAEKLERAKALANQWLEYLSASPTFEGSYIQAVAYQYLGRLYLNTAAPEEAIRVALLAEDGLKNYVENTDLVRLTNIHTIAVANSFLGRNDEAIAAMREVVEGQTGRLGSDHPYTLMAHSDLGGMLTKGGFADEAVDVLSAAREGALASHGPAHFSALMVGYNLSSALGAAGQHAQAMTVLNEISDEGKHVFPPEHQWAARIEFMYGKLAAYREDWAEAEEHMQRSIPMLNATAGVDQGTKDEAAALLRTAIAKREAEK